MKNEKMKIWFFSVLCCLLLVTSAHAASVYQKAAGIYPVSWRDQLTVTGEGSWRDQGTGHLTVRSNKTWTYKGSWGTGTSTYQIKGNKAIIAKTKAYQNSLVNEILDWVRSYTGGRASNLSAKITRFTITSPSLRNGKPKGTTVTVNVAGVVNGTYLGYKFSRNFKYQQVSKIQ